MSRDERVQTWSNGRPAGRPGTINGLACPLVCVIAFTLWSTSAATATRDLSDDTSSSISSSEDQSLREYRGYRRMHAWSERGGQEAWLEAWTELKDGKFEYRILDERGSNTIRSRVLRVVLQREQELVNQGDADRADLTSENYEFGDAGREADGSQVVPIKPRRKDVLLVDGQMVLTPDGRQLVRVEGRLAKNPSFWTSLVNIVRHYATLGGVRVPISSETTAKIKFAGTAQLEVAYEYESVNGRPVGTIAHR